MRLEKITLDNKYYRKVLETTKQSQLVVMNLKPLQQIGMEIHPKTTQFIRIESGTAIAVLDGISTVLKDGDSIMIPAGVEHNILAGTTGAKLYTIYSPPHHPPKLIQKVQV